MIVYSHIVNKCVLIAACELQCKLKKMILKIEVFYDMQLSDLRKGCNGATHSSVSCSFS